MRNTDKNRLQVLRRVRDYLQPMAKDPALTGAYAELEGVIVRLTDEGARQDGQRRQAKIGTDTVMSLAATLRNDLLRPVVHLVKIVTPDAVPTGLPSSKPFNLPRSMDFEGLLTVAKGFHDTAKPYEDKLTAAGLPKDHLSRMLVGSDALKAAIDARAQNVLQRAAAGSSAIAQGKRAVQVLRLVDSLVQPLIRGDVGKQRGWAQAKRIGRATASVVEPASLPVVGGTPTSDVTQPVVPATVDRAA